jgi:hypothetical protein
VGGEALTRTLHKRRNTAGEERAKQTLLIDRRQYDDPTKNEDKPGIADIQKISGQPPTEKLEPRNYFPSDRQSKTC